MEYTRKELIEIGEMWTHRARKLGDIFSDGNLSKEKRNRALRLCMAMGCRINALVKRIQPNRMPNFNLGGPQQNIPLADWLNPS